MKCPRCHYISFDDVERCRNCGHEFASSAPDPRATRAVGEGPGELAELPLQDSGAREGPASDLPLGAAPAADPTPRPVRPAERRGPELPSPSDLPLFDAPMSGLDDTPLLTAPAAPRPPLAVRRSTVESGRAPVAEPAEGPVRPRAGRAAGPSVIERRPSPGRGAPAQPSTTGTGPAEDTSGADGGLGVRRAGAALLDALILGGIDLAVIDLTLRVAGLEVARLSALPPVPLVSFLLLLDGGYLVGFTAAAGQTIGKMLTGVQVVTDTTRRVPLGQAIVRAAGLLLTVATLGLGYLPAFVGGDRRALHDRLSGTRVRLR